MAAVKWGAKKCQGHVKSAAIRRALKREVEKKTRQAARQSIRKEVE